MYTIGLQVPLPIAVIATSGPISVVFVALANRNDSFGTHIAIIKARMLLIARPPPTAVRTIGPRSDSKTHRPIE